MSWRTLLSIVAVAVFSCGGSLNAAEPSASPRRQAQQLRQAVSRELRREATTTGAERDAAVRELVNLHGELGRDATLAPAERERLKGLIRSRLLRVQQRLERQPANVRLPEQFGQVLGQQLNQVGQAVGRGPLEQSSEALLDLIKTTIRPDTWQEVGGPGVIRIFPGWGASSDTWTDSLAAAWGGPAVDDHGPELVELIQTVIAPPSWDVNGGPGVIVYYRSLRVLVVRQTSEVHDQVGAAVGGLRQ